MMNKLYYRKYFQELRSQKSLNEIESDSITIANNLLSLPIWQATYYHLFLTIAERKEIDTSFLLSILQGKDKKIVIPKVEQNKRLSSYLLTDRTILKKNKWHIPEPQNSTLIPECYIDVVFVPLLAYDRKGNRIGYGGGFYDAFLRRCNPEVIKIGLSFFPPLEETIPVEEHDIALDYVATPNSNYSFS